MYFPTVYRSVDFSRGVARLHEAGLLTRTGWISLTSLGTNQV